MATNGVNGSATAPAASLPVPQHRHIWIVTGPAGCGKTTVGQYLAQTFTLPYLEGDSYHPKANIDKMAAGIALTDADRWDWLVLLRQQSIAALNEGATGVVVTCSALKRKYRDVMRIAAYNDHQVQVRFIYLSASPELLLQRVHGRVGHYMKDTMVQSQLASLEHPQEDESDILTVDVSGDFASVQRLALAVVNQVMTQDAGQAA